MEELIRQVAEKIRTHRFPTYDEKELQNLMYEVFLKQLGFEKEYYLDSRNIVDFFHKKYGLALEVKIKGSAPAIHRQCKRYMKFDEVKALCLASAKATGWPDKINGKPSFYIGFGQSWL